MQFSFGLAAHYARLWDTMMPVYLPPNNSRPVYVFNPRMDLTRDRWRYDALQYATGVPWCVAAIIHQLEGDGDFTTCLHNGDPLPGPTTHEPRGRGPFPDWESAAIDAIQMKTKRVGLGWDVATPGVDGVKPEAWTVEAMLYFLERWNGWGYMLNHDDINSPYLWAGTNHYERGKYASDGLYDPNLVSQQVGGAALLRALIDSGAWTEKREDIGVAGLETLAPGEYEGARLQQTLNHLGIVPPLVVDGDLGPKTIARMKKVYPAFFKPY